MSNPLSTSIGASRFLGNGRAYADPFVNYATLMMPRTMEDILRWSESLWHRNGTYAMASQRVVSYFLTKVDITDASEDEKKKYIDFLENQLKVMTELEYLGKDFLCYGNSFSSLYVPFRRFLRCSKDGCKVEQPIDKVDYKFKAFKFEFTCNACGHKNIQEKPIDRRTMEEHRVRIIRWSPHHIKLRYHPVSREYRYFWDPPANVRKQINQGDPFWVESMPWEMIETIKKGPGTLFEFAPKVIYHMREESLSGIYTNGWGVTRFLTNFSQAFYVQILKLYNEILATEYIVPMRVVSPAPGSSNAADPMISTNLGSTAAKVMQMFRNFRRNPGGWNFVPTPLQYQAMGAEGMQFSAFELIDQAMDEMLNAAGIPAELYKGTLTIQALPAALRLFQQTWPHLVSAYNGWLQWLMESLSIVFNWEPAVAKLQPVTLADDMENKQILLQLAASNQVSKHRAFAALGIDVEEDQKTIFDEKKTWDEAQQQYQTEMQNKQTMEQQMQSSTMQAAGAAPPGQAAQQGQSVSIDDKMAQAEQMSQQLLNMPYEQRKGELLKIKKADPTLHALVKQMMEDQRTQNESVGGQQVQQQQQQQPGQPPQQA